MSFTQTLDIYKMVCNPHGYAKFWRKKRIAIHLCNSFVLGIVLNFNVIGKVILFDTYGASDRFIGGRKGYQLRHIIYIVLEVVDVLVWISFKVGFAAAVLRLAALTKVKAMLCQPKINNPRISLSSPSKSL